MNKIKITAPHCVHNYNVSGFSLTNTELYNLIYFNYIVQYFYKLLLYNTAFYKYYFIDKVNTYVKNVNIDINFINININIDK
ncbi:hypothetical protein AGR56_11215 [Clostridium sp. DMHC 10]|nr:hypothetical protein AGR56_11215 [Clostridium sp. DMHC 10]